MKSTGVVRKIDNLGRFVIPKEVRRILGIKLQDPLEVYTDNDIICIKKYIPTCILCGNGDDTIEFNDKKICKKCILTLYEEIQPT